MISRPAPQIASIVSKTVTARPSKGGAGGGGDAPREPEHVDAESAKPRIDRDDANVALRLSIGRTGIGFELARPAHLETVLVVRELDVALPNVRFPLDVSGGMARFRHRRGDLTKLSLEIPRAAAAKLVASRLRGLVSIEAPLVWLRARAAAATVVVYAPDPETKALASSSAASASPPSILAFELLLEAHGRDLRLVVTEARGTGLAAPPTALAIQAVARLAGKTAERRGSTFVLSDALGRLARRLFPEAGVRAPSVRGASWTTAGASGEDDAWILQASTRASDFEPSAEMVRAREVAKLCAAADEARVAGEYAEARKRDLAALAGAARHPEIARRVAEIDHAAGDRSEAALATLREAERIAPARSGTLRAELLEATGDRDGARAAYIRTGEAEEAPALSARAFEKAAELAPDAVDALVWLDRAVAELPESTRLRWARVARRIAAGRIDDARADVEAIAAMSAGGKASYVIWRRAADAWARGGLRAEASLLYERALRWVPDDPAALAGLGEALANGNRAARGATLIARAIDLANATNQDTSAMALSLAVVLAEKLNDLPAAAARARQVPGEAKEAAGARGLEGRWRAALGDRVGASLAFARLREAADERKWTDVHLTVELLAEAAAFERDVRGDLPSAQRHLAVALALDPHDASLQRSYRELGARLAPSVEPFVEAAAPVVAAAPEVPNVHPTEPPSAPVPAAEAEPFDEGAATMRVEELTMLLRMRPEDDAVVDELARLLTALDRSFDLLALLSARLEDASPDVRARLLPKQRDVLRQLATVADVEGRTGEASLFRDYLDALAE